MHPPGKLAFSNIAEGRAKQYNPYKGEGRIWQYLTKYNPAIPFLEIFQKIDPHRYEPTYIHKLIQGGIPNNKKKIEIIQMAMGEWLNQLQ